MWNAVNLETLFKDLAATQQIKPGELQLAPPDYARG